MFLAECERIENRLQSQSRQAGERLQARCGSHAIHATGSISRPIRRRSARRHMFQRFWIIRFLMEFRDKVRSRRDKSRSFILAARM